MNKANECTCPSGNGSLRHPCPAHPAPVEQAGGDERAAFEFFVRKHCGMPEHIAVNWDAKFTNDAWEGWKARAALAQPSPAQAEQAEAERPEEFSFEYRHPNGECHTVTVSREQVINEMPDFLFEALCSKLCNCEPVGETNVVECRCDEYAEEFKLLAAAPGKEEV